MTRWRAEDLTADQRSMIAEDPCRRAFKPWGDSTPPDNPKYRNKIVFIDGQRFHSKLEAQHYEQLKLARAGGLIRTFLRQVPFLLGGGVRHIVDWMVIDNEGRARFFESKGYDQKTGRMKRKLVHAQYGVEIKIWGQPEIQL